MKRWLKRASVSLFLLACCLSAASGARAEQYPELEAGFREFLAEYVEMIRSGNTGYLEAVHPSLPREKRESFIGITLDMMQHARSQGLAPSVSCRQQGICKAVWPQPGGSWAAQTFVLREGQWQWLTY